MIGQFNKYGLTFRTVEEEDAFFILELRNNQVLSRFLSPTNPDVEQQKEWIRCYKQREEQNEEAYFISLDDKGGRQGLNRLYNYEKDCYEIGSWLYKPGLDMSVAILGDLAARDYGFETLGFSTCKFEVRKANLSVVKYHLRFNPEKIGETDFDYYFSLSYDNYKKQRDKLLKILDNGAR
ncbi:MAG: Butyryltransferase [Segetibacter sp.]|nr:Butyryltransferase [Segetibacter sp.]